MEQRTCNIIMCCKGYCQLEGAGDSLHRRVAAYMSHECACPIGHYNDRLIQSILMEALYDYMNSADNPGFDLRKLFCQHTFLEPGLSERIRTMFQLIRVRNDDGSYANGPKVKLIWAVM